MSDLISQQFPQGSAEGAISQKSVENQMSMVSATPFKISPGWFRLFLAFVVVFYHATRYVFFGFWAVFVFFILSGYWITEMYQSRYSKAAHPVRMFYLSRILRLYPVFASCTLLVLVLIWSGIFEMKADSKVVMDFNWFVKSWILLGYSAFKFRPLVPGWSLDIELQFYLLFPLIFIAIKSRGMARFASALLVAILSLSLSRLFGFLHSISLYMPFFLTGVAISRYRWEASVRLKRLGLASLAVLFLLIVILPESRSSILNSGLVYFQGNDLTLYVDAFMAFLTIPFVSGNVRIRDSEISRHAGNLSFEVYLVHWIVLRPYDDRYGQLPMLQRLPFFLGYVFLTVSISLLIYALVDVPAEKFRRRMIGRLSAAHTPTPST